MSSSDRSNFASAGSAPSGERLLSDVRDALFADRSTPLQRIGDGKDAESRFHSILPLCRRAQITRLADLTGLDRLGLPVVQAVRPAALSEVTALGRGFRLVDAAIGAIMESLERFYAEDIPQERIFRATAEELGIAEGLYDRLLLPERGPNWRHMAIPWISGIELATGATVPVPLELVHTHYTEPPPDGDGVFVRTTTGLACHVKASAAFLHGLFECLERDAIARAFTTHGFFDRMRIPIDGLGEDVERILAVAGRSGISFGLWRAPSPAGVAVVWCQAIEAGAGEPLLALPAEGYAAAPSFARAASSAMLEALSGRVGAISGARDDQTRVHYRKRTDALVENARRLILDTAPQEPPPDDGPLRSASLGDLLGAVEAAGLGPVRAVPVASDPASGVFCIRTVLPGAKPFSIVR